MIVVQYDFGTPILKTSKMHTNSQGQQVFIRCKVFVSSFIDNGYVIGPYPVDFAFDGNVDTFWHSYDADQGKMLIFNQQKVIDFSGETRGGIFKVVFNQPTSIEAIRLYRRKGQSNEYNKLSVTVRVSFKITNESLALFGTV